MSTAPELEAAPSAWPALLALGVVVVLAIGELGFDLYEGSETYAQTSHIVENSLTSVIVVDDLQYQAAQLVTSQGNADRVAEIIAQLDADLRDYEPLATDPGEREEYQRVLPLLDELRHGGTSPAVLATIEQSIDRLVDINQRAAYASAEAIRATHDRELAADVVVGAITLTLAIVVGVVLLRAIRRQRALLAMHLASLARQRRELEAFAASASHDLKGPLSPLRGYADLLAVHSATDVREVGVRIRRAADRMTGIIDELLALSVHGTPPLGTVSVAGVVREVVDELQAQLADADVRVAIDDVSIACSPGVLGQIVRNVVTNASKYRSPDRKLALKIETSREPGLVALTFSDNGLGMDADAVAHAFEPMYRAPGSSAPGHGLGLSIVKRAVEAVGGSCALTSTPGAGTRVVVKLRLG